MKRLIIFITLPIFIYNLSFWRNCEDFIGKFHFSLFDLELRIMEGIHNDTLPHALVRVFHNKILGSIIDVYNHYMQFLNIHFMISLLTVVGLLGLGMAAVYAIKQKHILLLSIGFILSLLPLGEIVFPQKLFVLKLLLIAPYFVFSLIGWWHFLDGKKHAVPKVLLFFMLVGLSVWWSVVFGSDASTYCVIPQ